MRKRKPHRGKNSRNSKFIETAVQSYLAIPPDQRRHGVKRTICDRYGVRPQSFSSALKRHTVAA